MFDESILQLPTKDRKRTAIEAVLLDRVENGTFSYTELLLHDAGIYTVAFEILDGISTNAMNVPQASGRVLSVGPVRLVSIDPKQPLRYSELYTPRIPGSAKRGEPIKRVVELGLDAMVDDSMDNGRIARGLLMKHGWPIRNVRSRSGIIGHIVEMRWLEKACAEKGDSEELREVRQLLAEINSRTGDATSRKSPRAASAAGVSP